MSSASHTAAAGYTTDHHALVKNVEEEKERAYGQHALDCPSGASMSAKSTSRNQCCGMATEIITPALNLLLISEAGEQEVHGASAGCRAVGHKAGRHKADSSLVVAPPRKRRRGWVPAGR